MLFLIICSRSKRMGELRPGQVWWVLGLLCNLPGTEERAGLGFQGPPTKMVPFPYWGSAG